MPDLTWGDFKRLVEAAGVQDSDTLTYFDFSYPYVRPDGTTDIEVFRDAEHHSVVVH